MESMLGEVADRSMKNSANLFDPPAADTANNIVTSDIAKITIFMNALLTRRGAARSLLLDYHFLRAHILIGGTKLQDESPLAY